MMDIEFFYIYFYKLPAGIHCSPLCQAQLFRLPPIMSKNMAVILWSGPGVSHSVLV